MSNEEISLFDTKSRQLQPLTSSDGKKLRIYSCGPTVYRDAHVSFNSTWSGRDDNWLNRYSHDEIMNWWKTKGKNKDLNDLML